MDLIPSLQESLFNNPATYITADFLEVGLDSFLENDTLKNIPVFGSIIRTANVAYNIHQYRLLKNTESFLKAFWNNDIAPGKIDSYKKHLENPKHAEKELGRVLVLLDRFIDKKKSVLLAELYKKYVNSEFNWSVFCELSDIVDTVMLEDINFIVENKESIQVESSFNILSIPYNLKRLEAIGVVSISNTYTRFGDQLWLKEDVIVSPTDSGIIIINAILSAQ